MSYQVLARKWRPQRFDAVVGQEAVTRTLRNALASGRVAHAYLFAGPRGVGKTTTARLLARALLCPARTGAEPCGACDVCRDAAAGTAVDIVEIDAASNRGIDEIRALRENVKYAPARGRYKVYIIDEVHQLTSHAFDALLKTLEEPPPHVVFVLATTDPRDVPPTVLSRVQRFDFRPIPPETLARSLERVLAEEGVTWEPEALPVIVRAAEGSLRDALSLLDTAIAYAGGRLTAAAVAELLGAPTLEAVRAFAAALLGGDTAAALEAIARAAAEGEDLAALVRDTLETLRRALVLKAAPRVQLPDLSPTEAAALRELAEGVSLDELLYVLRALLDAEAEMRESPEPRVELEIAAVRATRRPRPQALEDVLRRLDELHARLGADQPVAAAAGPVQASLLAPLEDPGAGAAPAGAPAAEATAARGGDVAPRGGGAAPRATPPPAGAGELDAAWQRVVEEVMRKKPTVGAVLAQARPVELREGELVVAVAGNHFHRELLADRANRELVQAAVRRAVPGAERFRAVEAEGAAGEVRAHPLVQAVVEAFEGEVVAVRPRPPEGDGP